jgi:N-acetylneuraminic acid mutarotase
MNWQFGTNSAFGGTRFDGEYVAALNRVYFLGFRTFADATDGSVWYYDVANDTYVDTGVDMPVPVSNYKIAALMDTHGLGLYIFGGRDSLAQIVTTVQVYYPQSNQALMVNTDPWPGTTPGGCVSLPAMGVDVIANKAYVMGGLAFAANGCIAGDENSAQTWIFNPASPGGRRWQRAPDLNLARGYITTAVLKNRIFAIGGDTNEAAVLIPQSIVESWAPGTPAWNDASVADLPVGCDESQAFVLRNGPAKNGIILANCGQWPNATPDTYFYKANTWSIIGAMNESRRNEAGALSQVAGRPTLYIVGGYDCPGNACLADPTTTVEFGSSGAVVGSRPGFSRPGRTLGHPATN